MVVATASISSLLLTIHPRFVARFSIAATRSNTIWNVVIEIVIALLLDFCIHFLKSKRFFKGVIIICWLLLLLFHYLILLLLIVLISIGI